MTRLHLEHVIVDDQREEVAQISVTSKSAMTPSFIGRHRNDDAFGRAAEHAFGFEADTLDLAGSAIDRDDGRLIEHDSFAFDVIRVFAVPRSTAIAFAGKRDPGLKGQRIRRSISHSRRNAVGDG